MNSADISQTFNTFATGTTLPIIYTIIFIFLTLAVLFGGVKDGIEKYSKI